MSKNDLSTSTSDNTIMQGLGGNERAILERIPVPFLRKLITAIWRVKLRVQYTGWLQYIPPATIAILLLLIAGSVHLLGAVLLAVIFLALGTLLLIVVVFDLITVKWGLRIPERLPKRHDGLNLFDLMRARRSCRSFQIRKLTEADKNELMESVRMHSTAPLIGVSPVRFEYIAAPLTVWPVVNATEFLVAIIPKEYDRLAVIDVGRSLQKVVMDATRMGLGTCWIGPGVDHASIKQNLGDRFNPEKDQIVCVCAVGYRSQYIPLFLRIFNAQFNRRLPLSSLFFADADFEQPLDLGVYPFSRFGRTFEICQWAPSSYNGQTTRCIAVTEKDGHDKQLKRVDFYATTASRYYAAVAVGIWCANWELGCDAVGIQGHFAVLSSEAGYVPELDTTPPRYDLSWVLDEGL